MGSFVVYFGDRAIPFLPRCVPKLQIVVRAVVLEVGGGEVNADSFGGGLVEVARPEFGQDAALAH